MAKYKADLKLTVLGDSPADAARQAFEKIRRDQTFQIEISKIESGAVMTPGLMLSGWESLGYANGGKVMLTKGDHDFEVTASFEVEAEGDGVSPRQEFREAAKKAFAVMNGEVFRIEVAEVVGPAIRKPAVTFTRAEVLAEMEPVGPKP